MSRQVAQVRQAWEVRHQKGWARLKPEPIILGWIRKYRSHMGQKVVDLGCGSGRYLVPLIKMGFSVTGIELTDTALGQLNSRLKKEKLNATVWQGDFRRMKLKSRSFDSALAVQSFQLGDWQIIKRSFSWLAGILKPGGLFVLRVRSMRDVPADADVVCEKHDLPKTQRGVTYNRTYDTGHRIAFHHFSKAELDFLSHRFGFDFLEGPIERKSRKMMDGSPFVTGQWNAVLRKRPAPRV